MWGKLLNCLYTEIKSWCLEEGSEVVPSGPPSSLIGVEMVVDSWQIYHLGQKDNGLSDH